MQLNSSRLFSGWWMGFLIFLITVFSFYPSLRDGFVKWDDDMTFYENPHIQNWSGENVRWMLTNAGYAMRYKPLSWLLYALVNSTCGMNPRIFHAIALLFHSLNAVMWFVVLRILFRAALTKQNNSPPENIITISCAVAALLWAVNPLRVEPVARATDLTYSQCLFFVLISLFCHLRAVSGSGTRAKWSAWRVGSILAFAISMLSYPFVFAYSVVLVVLDFYPLRRFENLPGGWSGPAARPIWMEKIPYFILSGLICATFAGRLNPDVLWSDGVVLPKLSLPGKIMQAFYVCFYYLWKPWLPVHLAPVYTELVGFNPWSEPFLLSAVVVTGLSAFVFWKRNSWPLGLALWVCYLALLIPALGLTERQHFTSDRYSYVVGILWPILIAAFCVKSIRWPGTFAVAVTLLGILIVTSSAASLRQVKIWRNSNTLFPYVINELGTNGYRATVYLLYGTYQLEQGQNAPAIENFKSSVKIKPDSAGVQGILGIAYLQTDQFADAEKSFREALKYKPNYTSARVNLGYALLKENKTDEAITELESALRANPNNFSAQQTVGVLLCNKGLYDDAIAHLHAAINQHPDYPEAYNGLAVAVYGKGRLDEAIADEQTAVRLKPDYADASNNLIAFQKQKSGATNSSPKNP